MRAVCPGGTVKLVPVVLGRDANTAFDMLWMLGAGLSVLGHAVVALDSTSQESPAQPGLAELLGGNEVDSAEAGEGLHILAAQSGLKTLLATVPQAGPHSALERLAACFEADTVVLVLASKEHLSVLFDDTAARPLIPLLPEPMGVVDAYSAVKVLMHAANVQPVLVPVRGEGPEEMEQQALKVLLQTAHKHLGRAPDCWALPDNRPGENRHALSGWMLKIVGSALPVPTTLRHLLSMAQVSGQQAPIPHLWSC